METVTPLLIGSVWLAGTLSFFSPCILPLLPVYLGLLTGNIDTAMTAKQPLTAKAIIRTLLLISGLSTVFLILGAGISYLGNWLNNDYLPLLLGGSCLF